MNELDLKASPHKRLRIAALPLALAFLIEIAIWRRLVGVARWVLNLFPWERFRSAARRFLARAPALVSVALFGIPVAVAELGSFFSVVMIATGHPWQGAALYLGMKVFGLVLVPVVFEITRERLMALPWFAYLYAKFEAAHRWASEIVAPYRRAALQVALASVGAIARWARGIFYPPPSAARASAANAETPASSARAVPSKPASLSH